MSNHTVKAGECISGIAQEYGHHWRKVWDNNPELQELRANPNILLEGDVVKVPEKKQKTVTVSTGATHRYRRVEYPSKIRLRLLVYGQPRPGLKYTLEIDGRDPETGVIDADGYVSAWAPPEADEARLTVETDRGKERYTIRLGYLDPFDEVRGVQQRLRNLDIACEVTGEDDAQTRQAVSEFQARTDGLEVNGDPRDAATIDKLREAHGS